MQVPLSVQGASVCQETLPKIFSQLAAINKTAQLAKHILKIIPGQIRLIEQLVAILVKLHVALGIVQQRQNAHWTRENMSAPGSTRSTSAKHSKTTKTRSTLLKGPEHNLKAPTAKHSKLPG